MSARDLLRDLAAAGFQVEARADTLVIRPWSKLPTDMRAALRACKPDLLALLAGASSREPEAFDLAVVAWTDADIVHFLDRRARLLRWGWLEPEAEKLAERLVIRDRERDARVSCTDCRHYRPGRCGNHRRAGLRAPDVGRDLAATLQRCPGFDPRTTA